MSNFIRDLKFNFENKMASSPMLFNDSIFKDRKEKEELPSEYEIGKKYFLNHDNFILKITSLKRPSIVPNEVIKKPFLTYVTLIYKSSSNSCLFFIFLSTYTSLFR